MLIRFEPFRYKCHVRTVYMLATLGMQVQSTTKRHPTSHRVYNPSSAEFNNFVSRRRCQPGSESGIA